MASRLRLPVHVLAGACLFVLGCGATQGDLAGTVSYQGKTLHTGSVQVLGNDGIARSSLILADGSYLIRNIPIGDIKVAVNSPAPTDAPPPGQRKQFPKNDAAPAKAEQIDWFSIPQKYADFNRSGLTMTLKAGANTWDIELK
jgi:hypothetical protein